MACKDTYPTVIRTRAARPDGKRLLDGKKWPCR
jgi:hypothetical protein